MLPVAVIRKWLATSPISHTVLARYTGIPYNSLEWIERKDTAVISPDRQRLLSKVIAQMENGQLVFERTGPRRSMVPRLVANPKPIVRYGVDFTARGPQLRKVDRPKAFKPIITFAALLTKR